MELEDNQYILYMEEISSNERIMIGGYEYAITSNLIKETHPLKRIVSKSLIHLMLQTDMLSKDEIEILSDLAYRGKVLSKGNGREILTYFEKGVGKFTLRKVRKLAVFQGKKISTKIQKLDIGDFLRG